MILPKSVEIVDVAPRDGLQMLPNIIRTQDKVDLIHSLKRAGLRRIEATSFVSPKHVPQMADAEEVLLQIGRRKDLEVMAVALNEKGCQRAVDAKVDWICYVLAATETFNRENANTSLATAMSSFERAAEIAHKNEIKIRGSIAVAWVCPYEGDVSKERILQITNLLFAAGADEVAYNDTVGKATPEDVYELCAEARDCWPTKALAAHFHDTYFMGLANLYAALASGWTIFDSSIAGLGGCPFSPGASGNISTETVVRMLNRMGIETGVSEEQLERSSELANRLATLPQVATHEAGVILNS